MLRKSIVEFMMINESESVIVDADRVDVETVWREIVGFSNMPRLCSCLS